VTTSCSDVVSRARSFNALNTALTTDTVEMLSRIKADQQRVFTAARWANTRSIQNDG
jgi:hypothetical protein